MSQKRVGQKVLIHGVSADLILISENDLYKRNMNTLGIYITTYKIELI